MHAVAAERRPKYQTANTSQRVLSNDIIFNSERWFSFLTPKYKEFESEAAPAKCQNKAGALFIDDVPVRARTLKSHFCRQGT